MNWCVRVKWSSVVTKQFYRYIWLKAHNSSVTAHSSLEMISLQYNWDWHYGNVDLYADIALLSGDNKSNIIVPHTVAFKVTKMKIGMRCQCNRIIQTPYIFHLSFQFALLIHFLFWCVCLHALCIDIRSFPSQTTDYAIANLSRTNISDWNENTTTSEMHRLCDEHGPQKKKLSKNSTLPVNYYLFYLPIAK